LEMLIISASEAFAFMGSGFSGEAWGSGRREFGETPGKLLCVGFLIPFQILDRAAIPSNRLVPPPTIASLNAQPCVQIIV
jgi:hypothetical protein